jgi:hypothetical protein
MVRAKTRQAMGSAAFLLPIVWKLFLVFFIHSANKIIYREMGPRGPFPKLSPPLYKHIPQGLQYNFDFSQKVFSTRETLPKRSLTACRCIFQHVSAWHCCFFSFSLKYHFCIFCTNQTRNGKS